MLRLRVFALLVLCLSVVAPCFADTLSVTFEADFFYSPPGYVCSFFSAPVRGTYHPQIVG
jgi:hypothetical protein